MMSEDIYKETVEILIGGILYDFDFRPLGESMMKHLPNLSVKEIDRLYIEYLIVRCFYISWLIENGGEAVKNDIVRKKLEQNLTKGFTTILPEIFDGEMLPNFWQRLDEYNKIMKQKSIRSPFELIANKMFAYAGFYNNQNSMLTKVKIQVTYFAPLNTAFFGFVNNILAEFNKSVVEQGQQNNEFRVHKYCSRCGAPLRPMAKFCPHCGQPVERANIDARINITENKNKKKEAESRIVKKNKDASTSKIIAVIILILVITVTFFIGNPRSPINTVSITAEQLMAEYNRNPQEADKKYKDKYLEVTGPVLNVGKFNDSKDKAVTMYNWNYDNCQFSVIGDISAKDSNLINKISKLQGAKNIRLKGTCKGLVPQNNNNVSVQFKVEQIDNNVK